MSKKRHHDDVYLNTLFRVIKHGEERVDRTGVGTIGVFGEKMVFDLSEDFPLLTSKSVHWKSVVAELLWFLRGDTNVKWLNDRGCTIWDEWADENGDLGPVYGAQWRSWGASVYSDDENATIDQIAILIDNLKNNPHSRRHVVSAWNPPEIEDMALPPCHCLFQFWVSQNDNSLHCQLYQRSADIFLGVPFNIASYSLLLCILADTLGFKRGKFHWVGGDVHLYKNHREQADEQLLRGSYPPSPRLLKITNPDIFNLDLSDIILEDYKPMSKIPAPVAV